MAEPQESTPVFTIQRMYLKDLSLEQPNSPAVFCHHLVTARHGTDRGR